MRQVLVPLLNLREPKDAARTSYDPDALEQLARSMRELGQLQEIVVRPLEDGTYEIRAGMRRYLAARMAGIPELRACVLEDTDLSEAALIAENVDRTDLTPVEEALYYHKLYVALGEDTDLVAARLRRPRGHVEARLNLLNGQAEVLTALQAGEISLGVAEALNGMEAERDRLFYLEYARRGGCSVSQARRWRDDANTRARLEAQEHKAPSDPGAVTGAPAAAPAPPDPYAIRARPEELSSNLDPRTCFACGEQHPEWKMYRKFMCGPCAARLDEQIGPPGGRRG